MEYKGLSKLIVILVIVGIGALGSAMSSNPELIVGFLFVGSLIGIPIVFKDQIIRSVSKPGIRRTHKKKIIFSCPECGRKHKYTNRNEIKELLSRPFVCSCGFEFNVEI